MESNSMFKMLKLFIVVSLIHGAFLQTKGVNASEYIINVKPCQLDYILNHLLSPSLNYERHISDLNNQQKSDVAIEQKDKRSIAALAAQGVLRSSTFKRGVATLAKNGQLPTQYSENLYKAIARNKKEDYLSQKISQNRVIGTVDFKFPNAERNIGTIARLEFFSARPRRNLAAIARYNSMHMAGVETGNTNDFEIVDGEPSVDGEDEALEKRNIGALKASRVHGVQRKRTHSGMDVLPMPAIGFLDYTDASPNNFGWYPTHAETADLDSAYSGVNKRFLGRVLPPTRATASTHRG